MILNSGFLIINLNIFYMKYIDLFFTKNKKKSKKPNKTKVSKKKLLKLKKKYLLVSGIVLSVLILFFAFLILEPEFYKNKPFPNISLSGIMISSTSKNHLVSKITPIVENYQNSAFKYTLGDKKWEFTPSQNYITYDVDTSANDAINYGKQGEFFHAVWARLKLLFIKQNLPLIAEINNQKYQEFLDTVKKEAEYPYQNASLEFEGKNLIDIDAKDGLVVNETRFKKDLNENITYLKTSDIELKTKSTSPKLTAKNTTSARQKALAFISNPITIKYKDSNYEFSTDEIATWILFTEKKSSAEIDILSADLDETKIKNALGTKVDGIESEPQDVKLAFQNNQLVVLEKSRSGYGINYDQLVNDLDRTMQKTENRLVNLKLSVTKPTISENNLDSLGIKELIGEGLSSSSGSTRNRLKNIDVGTSKLQGYLIKPDEVFSLNTILGPIDGEHGFVPELVIKENKTIPEFGGGLCQVATTTFRAALMSGLPIVERKNHAYRVHYYEWPYGPGVDATIYPPHPDVQFKNDTGHYILIQTRVEGYKIYYDFYGTKNGREGKINKPVILWAKSDGSLATSFARDIIINGAITHTDTFKSIYRSPALYPTSR